MYRLCASFHVKVQSGFLQFLRDWTDETADIGIAVLLCRTEFILDVVVGIVLQILERQVFQFAFHLV